MVYGCESIQFKPEKQNQKEIYIQRFTVRHWPVGPTTVLAEERKCSGKAGWNSQVQAEFLLSQGNSVLLRRPLDRLDQAHRGSSPFLKANWQRTLITSTKRLHDHTWISVWLYDWGQRTTQGKTDHLYLQRVYNFEIFLNRRCRTLCYPIPSSNLGEVEESEDPQPSRLMDPQLCPWWVQWRFKDQTCFFNTLMILICSVCDGVLCLSHMR